MCNLSTKYYHYAHSSYSEFIYGPVPTIHPRSASGFDFYCVMIAVYDFFMSNFCLCLVFFVACL